MADDGGTDLFRTSLGIVGAHVLGSLVRLGVPDLLDDDGTAAADVAARLGVAPEILVRLLRAATALGAFAEVAPGRFAPTEVGRTLRAGHPSGEHALVQLFSSTMFVSAWPGMEEQARTEEIAFDAANGRSFFARLAEQPETSATFNTAMTAWTTRMAGPLSEQGGFDRFGTVVDVGGGNGTLLSILLAAHPGLRGVVFDTPTGSAQAPATLAAAGVGDRCTIETGDFFAGVPSGGDAYLLKNIVHDWDDDKAATILRHCRDALPDGGRVLVVETVVPETVETGAMEVPYLMDIAMLSTVGGAERSRDQYDALFRRAGLEPAGMVALPSETGFCLLEAVPA